MGELAGEEAPCQFSTRWRVLGKRGMRDDGRVRDSKRVGAEGGLCRQYKGEGMGGGLDSAKNLLKFMKEPLG